ncbi:TetR/AcrR family transcriptional regulator [Streptomyces sp. XM4193]|uniref:TetR/AcrR family transcriptional regulator n=1 Tax=Streptomyces sp. XM4193 TaxID=2929782 RepID=UPI001FFAE4B9|nr:TetR/AcrR family transcriptional regulator [Streptomyces sp. XM4193]MCK1797296.1 TetR/AcrR family transcriptional regulator [Streptomyces sp. XM4193]
MSIRCSRSPLSGRSKLTPERERELYDAVLDLLREVGYEALTMDAVASRTRSSKATLYRQWGNKSRLVVSAIELCGAPPPPMEGLGRDSLVEDLRELARWAGRDAARDVPLMRALGSAMQADGELLRAMRETIIEPELVAFQRLLDAAVERGEIAEVPSAVKYVPHLIFGALFSRVFIDGLEPDEEYVVTLVDEVVLPIFGLRAPVEGDSAQPVPATAPDSTGPQSAGPATDPKGPPGD